MTSLIRLLRFYHIRQDGHATLRWRGIAAFVILLTAANLLLRLIFHPIDKFDVISASTLSIVIAVFGIFQVKRQIK
ncbi:hypothetical protein [Sphingomonas sp. LaA6.9]|uniref:hypothetical protein n=1 Tax=Sphingomonas sp. LaA6.9 TaxID=2919914 RepID=UPI001F5036C1|nr:hypothetical protein [Sphingomonas sp. LaA6.9]MCJ8157639.1 hypothetical protein [Sphingomonas sp. LaA6.9]